jgi:hypothetical protein
VTAGPNRAALGAVAAEQLPSILYALEVCAVAMADAGRDDDAAYYRTLARQLAEAGGRPPDGPGV